MSAVRAIHDRVKIRVRVLLATEQLSLDFCHRKREEIATAMKACRCHAIAAAAHGIYIKILLLIEVTRRASRPW
jgi:hypothetical protein